MAFPDDDPKLQYPVDDPDLLNNRPILDRAAVISAGVIANVIFAWSILFTEVFLPVLAVITPDSSDYSSGVVHTT